ncbi:beta-lactamase family protein [Sphingomonas sinipercae]|uniref:Beta-lactamase family protein n=1 Tax=Sphingomonas sinipercae TaxID=2714944 RepID=A0A6G7ZND8_9SPHN|nr:serine hydrolase domain-containing protein [Sphingomonas sinipercae]QIL02438.1 beta-lactamase family protein [Sphingomonas sinipercae]
MAINRTGRTVFQEAVGVRQFGRNEPVSVHDQWHIGSNLKAMTALLYGRLVEQGRARWEASVGDLFPDLKLDPSWKALLVEDLLSHRAGIKDSMYARGPFKNENWPHHMSLPKQRQMVAELIFTRSASGVPGEYEYSNFGYILVAAAIDRLANQPYEQCLRQELIEPLKMNSVVFGPPQELGQPWGHEYDSVSKSYAALDPWAPDSDNPPIDGPAGRYSMTLSDYARFIRLFLNEGGGFVSRQTYAKLTAPTHSAGTPYSLGWLSSSPQGIWAPSRLLSHDGSNTFWFTHMVASPERGLAIIVAANAGSPNAVDACTYVRQQLQTALLAYRG